ncbi:MAG: ATP-binding cassette domain-containing protein [Oscillospiraceae bacterium]|nr:ATP-binding cassette domain-containing protein [Oscillospiraceae bacterium]
MDLTAESGSAFGLLGRNGAGKTTTIRIVMRIFPPDSGEVCIDGHQIFESQHTFGYLPEERGLYPKKKIGEQLAYIGMLRGMNKTDAYAAAKRWLKRLKMESHEDDILTTLSKGNQQKIQLCAALINDPEIVILDELFSGLDPVNAGLLKEVLAEQINRGRIVLFSSHEMNYVEEFCDNIAIMNRGEIVLNGNLRQIKRGYDRRKIFIAVDEALGSSAKIMEQFMQKGIILNIESSAEGAIVHLRKPDDKSELLSAICNKGIGLERFDVLEPTLEEIFIEKAGDSKDSEANVS